MPERYEMKFHAAYRYTSLLTFTFTFAWVGLGWITIDDCNAEMGFRKCIQVHSSGNDISLGSYRRVIG